MILTWFFSLFYLLDLDVGASFRPITLFTLYYKENSREGAVGGILTGFLTTIIWKVTGRIIYELVPAFFLSSIII